MESYLAYRQSLQNPGVQPSPVSKHLQHLYSSTSPRPGMFGVVPAKRSGWLLGLYRLLHTEEIPWISQDMLKTGMGKTINKHGTTPNCQFSPPLAQTYTFVGSLKETRFRVELIEDFRQNPSSYSNACRGHGDSLLAAWKSTACAWEFLRSKAPFLESFSGPVSLRNATRSANG